MKEKDKTILYKLFRDHEDVLGSSRMAMLALQSFSKSIATLRCSTAELTKLIDELCEAIKNTEPRIVPLIHLIKEFEKEMSLHYGDNLEQTKSEANRILKEKRDRLESNTGKVIEHGIEVVAEGDTLIVHTASSDVINMLVMARKVFRKDFDVKYVLTTYSHDIVDLKLIDFLITEDGKIQNR